MIWTLIASAVSSLGLPYAADVNRSVLGTPLPDAFIVYGLVAESPETHANDVETERFYRVQLSLYNRAGLSDLVSTDAEMYAKGFCFSRARALPFNPETGHFGLMREYTLLANYSLPALPD